jgi:hypothetical protein
MIGRNPDERLGALLYTTKAAVAASPEQHRALRRELRTVTSTADLSPTARALLQEAAQELIDEGRRYGGEA